MLGQRIYTFYLTLIDIANTTFERVVTIYPPMMPVFFLFIILQSDNSFAYLSITCNGKSAQLVCNNSEQSV